MLKIFKTVFIVSLVFLFISSAYAAEVLMVSPANNSINVPINPTLIKWRNVGSGAHYRLRIATDDGLTNIVINITTEDTSYLAYGLRSNTTYWWVVEQQFAKQPAVLIPWKFNTENDGPQISVTPASIDYGTVGYLSGDMDVLLTIKNISRVTYLDITSMSLETSGTPFEIMGNFTGQLAPLDWKTFLIRFHVNVCGSFVNAIRIKNNSFNNTDVRVPLSGNVLSSCLLVTPNVFIYDTATVVRPTSAQTFLIKNASLVPININLLEKTFVGNSEGFRFIKNDNNVTLAPGQNDTVIIEFNPTSRGLRSAVFKIISNDLNNTAMYVPLSGVCMGTPILAVSTLSLDFGTVRLFEMKEDKIRIQNKGNLPLNISNISLVGYEQSGFSVSRKGNRAVLNPGQLDTIYVSFTGYLPVGRKTAQAQIISDDPLYGIVNLNFEGFLKTQLLQKPDLRVYFDSTTVGEYKDSIVYLNNNGNDTLRITEFYIDGDYGDEFSSIGNISNLAPEEKLGLFIRFKPKGTGLRFARLAIKTNDPLFPENSLIFIGYGKSVYNLQRPSFLYVRIKEQPSNISLSWNKVVEASFYNVQVSTDSVFSRANSMSYNSVSDTFKLISGLSVNQKYYWRVQSVNDHLLGEWSEKYEFVTSNTVKESDNVKEKIAAFGLNQNYPNPFNPSTVISYQLTALSYITLKVFDAMGREAAVLAAGNQRAGKYEIAWNAANIPSGVYYYKLVVSSPEGNFVDMKKLILLK